ncbi:MAG: hypothetical protein LQ339_002829 [Xanthoria mediterranea]|nr:MAG: hypothetical protein LQ339_002829 [Xanthoria mediterranea]
MERDPRLLFQAFLFPAQQPHDFWTRRMSKPGVYQPTRWEFLRLLERDRWGGDWLLCSECFTLHPKRMFAPYQESIVPWLRHYYEAHDSDFRTCRHGRGLRSRPAFSPSGIVELCPCVKMTVGKKRLMEAWLRQKQGRSKRKGPAADFWWHDVDTSTVPSRSRRKSGCSCTMGPRGVVTPTDVCPLARTSLAGPRG